MTGDRFTAAVEDSHLLLAFLTRRSLTMDDRGQNQFRHYVGALARVQTLVAGGQVVRAADRAAFWESFTSLSDLAKPITVEEIRGYLRAHHQAAHADERKPVGLRLSVDWFSDRGRSPGVALLRR